MLNHTDYLIEALEQLELHAKEKLKESRKLYKVARKAYRKGNGGDSERFWQKSEELENEARNDLEQIQRVLANPTLNR